MQHLVDRLNFSQSANCRSIELKTQQSHNYYAENLLYYLNSNGLDVGIDEFISAVDTMEDYGLTTHYEKTYYFWID